CLEFRRVLFRSPVPAACTPDYAERRAAGRQGSPPTQQQTRDAIRVPTRQPHDADAAPAVRRCDGDNRIARAEHRDPRRRAYFGAITTVFRKASPTLSDVTASSSATTRWTMRRA